MVSEIENTSVEINKRLWLVLRQLSEKIEIQSEDDRKQSLDLSDLVFELFDQIDELDELTFFRSCISPFNMIYEKLNKNNQTRFSDIFESIHDFEESTLQEDVVKLIVLLEGYMNFYDETFCLQEVNLDELHDESDDDETLLNQMWN